MSLEKITKQNTTDKKIEYVVQGLDIQKDEYVELASYPTEQEAMFHAKNISDYTDIIVMRNNIITVRTTYGIPIAKISTKY